jgi:hypothetical protein
MSMAVPASSMTWKDRAQKVRYQSWRDPSWTYRETRLTIAKAAKKMGVSVRRALCVARRESGYGLDERAYNSSSGASGLFQHLRRYWPERVANYNRAMRKRHWLQVGPNVFDARSNALVSMWMARRSWAPWGGGC